jgi:hypothetical protein
MTRPRLTILFSGMIAGDPGQGGAAWAVLQYVLGFRRLGHEVVFVEPVRELTPASVGYFHRVTTQFGLERSSGLLQTGTTMTAGLDYTELAAAARRADLLVNISGMLADPELTGPIPRRVYLDLDPGFIQLWHAVQMIDMRFAGHTHFVTVGQSIGQPDCPVPTCGLDWIPTPQPIVLEHWPTAGPPARPAFTTVGNWRGYGSIEHDGIFYGQKAHSLRPLMELPRRTRQRFQPALSIHPSETRDLESLAANGWELLDPADVAGTPAAYRDFVRSSTAEFGLAKSGYVAAKCGWFSDRSLCYLASGRPVLAQDTGFGRWLPVGAGVVPFTMVDEAAAGADAIAADYVRHAWAARRLAEEFFDSDAVLSRLLTRVGAMP